MSNYLYRGIGVVATVTALSLLAFSLPSGGEARGDNGDHLMPRLDHPAWQQECSSCHIAYPPSMLPQASWRRLMSGLDNHFGDDASIDPATQADILKFLETHAADAAGNRMGRRAMKRADPKMPPLRITETRWFVHEHDEIPQATWARKSVGSAANCAACHRDAERGVFDDDSVRIPK
ncbi:MAG TPA: diheme cytochrome c [Thiobacillaceae bacterium]|nr:diheme cytochrome c [Thiobacillaceae bacterium]